MCAIVNKITVKSRFIDYIMPVGGETGLLICIGLCVIQEIHSKMLIQAVMKSKS